MALTKQQYVSENQPCDVNISKEPHPIAMIKIKRASNSTSPNVNWQPEVRRRMSTALNTADKVSMKIVGYSGIYKNYLTF